MKRATQRSSRLAVGVLAVLTAVAAAARVFAADACDPSIAGGPCPAPVGPMQCYEVKPGAFQRIPLTVEDEFGTLAASVRFPHRLCFSVDGNARTTSRQPQFLMGYEVRASFRPPPDQQVVDQFGTVTLDVKRPDLLLVPTAMSVDGPPEPLVPPLLDRFQCYRVQPSPGTRKFAPIRKVLVTDALETVVVDLLKPTRLCAPASLDGDDEAAPNRPTHLVCYKTRSAANFGEAHVFTRNRFGNDDHTLIHRRELCVPSPPAPPPTTTSTTTSTTTTSTSTSTTTTSTTTTSTSTSTTTTSTTTTSTVTSSTTTTTTTVPGPVCGDGIVDAAAGETCDDGNTAAGDCCSPTCQIDPDGTSCSDGDVCNGEEVCHGGRCEACQTSFGIAAVSNFRDDTVSLVNLATGNVTATVPVGDGPWGVAVHPRGTELWITNRREGSVSVIDLATRTVTATFPVGRVPLGVVLDASGARAYVASYGDNRVDVIDTATRTLVARFRVDRGPSSLIFDPTGQTLYVASFGANTVSALDPASGRLLARIRTPRKPLHLGIDGARGRLYVSNFGAGSVTVIGLVSRTLLTTIGVGRKPFGVAVDADRGRAWVSNSAQDTVVAIDTTDNDVAGVLPTASGPLGVAVDPAGTGRVLVISGNAGVLSVLEPSGATVGSLVVGAVPVSFGAFAGTAANDCPPRPSACEFSAIPRVDALDALLDALDETIRNAPPGSVRDPGTAEAISATIADARAALDAGGVRIPALRTGLRRLVGTVQRALRTGAVQRDTGFRLLDLGRRARTLLVPGTRGRPAPGAGGRGAGASHVEARPR